MKYRIGGHRKLTNAVRFPQVKVAEFVGPSEIDHSASTPKQGQSFTGTCFAHAPSMAIAGTLAITGTPLPF